MTNPHHNIDFQVLVDIISNVAGMMILLACMAVMVRQQDAPAANDDSGAKPIAFPASYLPGKRSLPLCLKWGQFYELPERDLLEAMAEKASKGKPVAWVSVPGDDVDGRLDLTPTITGFRFSYRLNPRGGIPLRDTARLVERLEEIIRKRPPENFFYVIHTWPECFEQFRDVRAFLHDRGVEVGWNTHLHQPPDEPGGEPPMDVVYSMGEYSENLSSIKAQ